MNCETADAAVNQPSRRLSINSYVHVHTNKHTYSIYGVRIEELMVGMIGGVEKGKWN